MRCEHCGVLLEIDDSYAGMQVECSNCHALLQAPVSENAANAVPTSPPTGVGRMQINSTLALRPSSGLAVAAMVCGIIGCATRLFPVGIVGIVLGIMAVSRINREPREYEGKEMAIAGICTGAVSIIYGLFFLTPAFMMTSSSVTRAKELSRQLICASNVKGFGTACRIYANDYDESFPPGIQTLLDTGDIIPRSLICPSSGDQVGTVLSSYIYIPGQTTESDPRNVLLYEKESNHAGEGSNVLFVDGHATFIKPYSRVEELVEETKARIAEKRTE